LRKIKKYIKGIVIEEKYISMKGDKRQKKIKNIKFIPLIKDDK